MKRRILIDPHNKYLIIEVACSRYIHTCIYIPQQPSQNSEGVMGGCGGGSHWTGIPKASMGVSRSRIPEGEYRFANWAWTEIVCLIVQKKGNQSTRRPIVNTLHVRLIIWRAFTLLTAFIINKSYRLENVLKALREETQASLLLLTGTPIRIGEEVWSASELVLCFFFTDFFVLLEIWLLPCSLGWKLSKYKIVCLFRRGSERNFRWIKVFGSYRGLYKSVGKKKQKFLRGVWMITE